MIKFFRKIRYDLTEKSKTGKYFKYAVGEIILVVIGILIALSINNWNESRKQEAKVNEALKEIHRDLSENIIESKDLIRNYRREDSIINILITKKLSIEDFKGNQGLIYSSTASNYYDLKINDNGYELLMTNSNNIPKKYQPLLRSLKNIYINDKGDLDQFIIFSKQEILSYLSHLKQNKEWYTDWSYNNKLTPEAIDYFHNDPYFKNHLSQYQALLLGNYYGGLHQFRIDAEASYQELTKILQLEDLVASDSTYYSINVKDYEHFLGTFKDDSANTAIISIESDQLFYQWNNHNKVKLVPTSRSTFIHALDYTFNSIQIDSIGQVISHKWRFGRQQGTLTKVN